MMTEHSKTLSVGRIVTKIMGREAGKKAIIVDIIDQNFVEISGPYEVTGVRRRRVNINHIEPTDHKIKITKQETDDKLITYINNDSDLHEFLLK